MTYSHQFKFNTKCRTLTTIDELVGLNEYYLNAHTMVEAWSSLDKEESLACQIRYVVLQGNLFNFFLINNPAYLARK